MAENELLFSCIEQRLRRGDAATVAEDAAGTVTARFSLCPTWDGLTVYARFKHQNAAEWYDVQLDGERVATVPHEVIEVGEFWVAVWGEANGEVLTSTRVFVPVAAGAAYAVGERVQHDGVLYRVLTAHDSQADWTPDAAGSLFAKVLTADDGTVLAWVQPDSTNGYATGDKVSHNGAIWVSLVDNNVWEPTADVPTLWAVAE